MDQDTSTKQLRGRIRKSLLRQLKLKNADTPYFRDQVEKYMGMWDVCDAMKKDIDKNGIQINVTLSTGVETLKTNEFVKMVPAYEKQMMATLNYLDLHVGNVAIEGDDDDADL